MTLNLVQSASVGFPIWITAEGIFEPEVDVLAKMEAGVEEGPLL